MYSPRSDRGRAAADVIDAPATADFTKWWAEREAAGRFSVNRIPFAEMQGWRFDPETGNLAHESGRFFSIDGVQTRVHGVDDWAQPIINQPEIGILGIIVKEFDGVLHCLMQAKMEPGNVNTLQLSPTVQATRSNYTQVHRGARTRYLDYFVGRRRGELLVDVLQSEQGAWFWRKRNRNMVVLATDDVEVHEDFRWLTLAEVGALMRVDNLVNMDARTVLSCLPFWAPDKAGPAGDGSFASALARSYHCESVDGRAAALNAFGEILSWFIEAKTRCDWSARLVPLDLVPAWRRTADEIFDEERRHFRIIAVQVEAGTREVKRWTQPLLSPRGQGDALFVVRVVRGVLHLLVQARPEYGLVDLVEMGPTVQLQPGEDPAGLAEPVLRAVVHGEVGTVRYDTVLSEEGGRFHQALTRYRIVEIDEDVPVEVDDNFCWMTVRQLTDLLRHGHYLNVEARSLLTCLRSLC